MGLSHYQLFLEERRVFEGTMTMLELRRYDSEWKNINKNEKLKVKDYNTFKQGFVISKSTNEVAL